MGLIPNELVLVLLPAPYFSLLKEKSLCSFSPLQGPGMTGTFNVPYRDACVLAFAVSSKYQ